MTRRHRPALGIVELAVDPADVDQETYPVRSSRGGDPGPVADPHERDLQRRPAETVGGARDRLHDPAAAVVEVGARRTRRSARRRRASRTGVPVRYLPVSTPRPSGDQGRTPRPSACAAGTTSCSTWRLSSEYSTWVDASGARPGTARCQVAACAVCQPV